VTPIEALKQDIEFGKSQIAKSIKALERFIEDSNARITEAQASIEKLQADVNARQKIVDDAEQEVKTE